MKIPNIIAMRRAARAAVEPETEDVDIVPENAVEATAYIDGRPVGQVTVIPNSKRGD